MSIVLLSFDILECALPIFLINKQTKKYLLKCTLTEHWELWRSNTRIEKLHKVTRAQVAAKMVPKRNKLIQETIFFLEYVKLNIVYVHLWSTFIYMQYNSLPHNSFGFKNSADVATEVISKVTPWHYESESLFA